MPGRGPFARYSLDEASRHFERWRAGRMFPGRIPFDLWRIAASAATRHGAEQTAARLRVDLARLKQWMGRLGEDGEVAEPAESVQFVELAPLTNGSVAECLLEIEEPSGRKLRIVLKGPATTRAMELGQMLWRSGP